MGEKKDRYCLQELQDQKMAYQLTNVLQQWS